MTCRKELPQFEELKKQYSNSVEFIALNLDVNDDINDIRDTIREFGLTMTMAIDKQGDLVQAFDVQGTPYHLLFDRDMNLVYRGYNTDESLYHKIDLVSRADPVDLLETVKLTDDVPGPEPDLDDGEIHALFFTASWCDTYLKDIRPQYSTHCAQAQNNIISVAEEFPDIVWYGILSRLWTGEHQLQEYRDRYAIPYPLDIDKSNSMFHRYSIRDLPTLVLIQNSEVILKLTELNDKERLMTIVNEIRN